MKESQTSIDYRQTSTVCGQFNAIEGKM